MKLVEIVKQADTLAPNSFPLDTKIAWINEIQNEFYRDYPVPDAVYPFQTVKNQVFYLLPEDCPEDRIQKVVIDGNTYDYVPLVLDSLKGRYWTIVAGQLTIYPSPDKVMDAFLYYRPRPMQLDIDSMDEEPDFPRDFQMILVYGCASMASDATGNDKLASTYYGKQLALAERAKRSLTKPRQRSVNIVRRWG